MRKFQKSIASEFLLEAAVEGHASRLVPAPNWSELVCSGRCTESLVFVRFSKGAGLTTSAGCGRSAVKGMTDDNGDSSSFSMTASALRGPRSGDGRREMNGPIERKLTGMSHSAQIQMQTCTHAETSS